MKSTISALCLAALVAAGCQRSDHQTVIIYTSQDEVYAEPILKEFTAKTGIEARPVYDSEAVKTVGLVNRLLTEKEHPQCDVFWNNEEFRTRQLAAHGVFRETNAWRELGCRSRRIVINTNLLTVAKAPKNFSDATNAAWRGKFALAYPLFGTTATHFQVWRQWWGDARWQGWCRALAANQPFIVDGNSVVVKMVERGEAWAGFTDSDDIASAQREGFPVAALPTTDEGLVVPNTVAVVRGCPHPEAAQKLYEFLSDQQVSAQLVAVHALEAPTSPPNSRVDWDKLLADLEQTTAEAKSIFLR
ncbi:MAG TPA: extracellular solute-binding protein [Verrucomicrobiae bacterium]|jgi:iron(III) transport system substrate-binding protein|nr:extracellular solute-binding protein [Verrucomicrobiae bacterium]